jgi:hypothetical protein
MKTGNLVQVRTGSGYFEEGEDTTCFWPAAKGQVGIIVEMGYRRLRRQRALYTAKVMILNEIAEFDISGLELVPA